MTNRMIWHVCSTISSDINRALSAAYFYFARDVWWCTLIEPLCPCPAGSDPVADASLQGFWRFLSLQCREPDRTSRLRWKLEALETIYPAAASIFLFDFFPEMPSAPFVQACARQPGQRLPAHLRCSRSGQGEQNRMNAQKRVQFHYFVYLLHMLNDVSMYWRDQCNGRSQFLVIGLQGCRPSRNCASWGLSGTQAVSFHDFFKGYILVSVLFLMSC